MDVGFRRVVVFILFIFIFVGMWFGNIILFIRLFRV